MEIKDFAVIIGSFSSAASVLWAIRTFKLNNDKMAFAKFRLNLVDLRHLVKKLDKQLDADTFAEVALGIAEEIRQIFTDDITVEELISSLKDVDQKNYVRQAIYQGITNAPSHKVTEDIIEQLDRITTEFAEQFPIVAAIVRQLNFYGKRAAKGTSSPKTFRLFLNDDEKIDRVFAPELRKQSNARLAYREIAVLIADISGRMLDGDEQGNINDVSDLMEIIINTFSVLSDPQLKKQSVLQKELYKRAITKIDNKTSIEDAYEYLDLINPVFTRAEWNKIVEAKTRIFERERK